MLRGAAREWHRGNRNRFIKGQSLKTRLYWANPAAEMLPRTPQHPIAQHCHSPGACNTRVQPELARAGGQGWGRADMNEDRAVDRVGTRNAATHCEQLWRCLDVEWRGELVFIKLMQEAAVCVPSLPNPSSFESCINRKFAVTPVLTSNYSTCTPCSRGAEPGPSSYLLHHPATGAECWSPSAGPAAELGSSWIFAPS